MLTNNDRIGACGDNCSKCPRYIATVTKDTALLRHLSSIWLQAGWRDRLVDPQELACYGCPTSLSCSNGVRQCAMTHSADNCGECKESKDCKILSEVLDNTEKNKKTCFEIFPVEIYEILDKSFFRKGEYLKLHK